MSQYKHRL